MSLPTIAVEIAFSTNPMSTPTWTDVSADVRAISIRRGRQHELDRIEAGTATIKLKNTTRNYDPTYTAGPYYGNLWPMRRVRIRATDPETSTVFDLFNGYVESWPLAWLNANVGEVDLEAVDGLKVLNLAKLNTTYAQQRSDVRINAVLDDANWTTGSTWVLDDATNSELGVTTRLAPNGDRAIAGGQATVQGVTLSDTTALQHLHDIVDAEGGAIYIAASGAFIFLSRHSRLSKWYASSLATFRDRSSDTEYYHRAHAVFDDDWIYNDIRVTRTGGTEQAVSDSDSQDKYGIRTLSRTGQAMTADIDALYTAQHLLSIYKDLTDPNGGAPMIRFDTITVQGQAMTYALAWYHLMMIDLEDRITIERSPTVDETISQSCIVTGIEHDIASGYWETRFRVRPNDTAGYWLLEQTGFSELGETTRLSY